MESRNSPMDVLRDLDNIKGQYVRSQEVGLLSPADAYMILHRQSFAGIVSSREKAIKALEYSNTSVDFLVSYFEKAGLTDIEVLLLPNNYQFLVIRYRHGLEINIDVFKIEGEDVVSILGLPSRNVGIELDDIAYAINNVIKTHAVQIGIGLEEGPVLEKAIEKIKLEIATLHPSVEMKVKVSNLFLFEVKVEEVSFNIGIYSYLRAPEYLPHKQLVEDIILTINRALE